MSINILSAKTRTVDIGVDVDKYLANYLFVTRLFNYQYFHLCATPTVERIVVTSNTRE